MPVLGSLGCVLGCEDTLGCVLGCEDTLGCVLGCEDGTGTGAGGCDLLLDFVFVLVLALDAAKVLSTAFPLDIITIPAIRQPTIIKVIEIRMRRLLGNQQKEDEGPTPTTLRSTSTGTLASPSGIRGGESRCSGLRKRVSSTVVGRRDSSSTTAAAFVLVISLVTNDVRASI